MLKIRFSKVGRKHEPVYRLVLTEHQNAAKSGKSLEILGSYDSRKSEKAEINVGRVNYWMGQGAKLSDTVHNLLLRMNIIKGEKINILPKKILEAAKIKKLEADKPIAEIPVDVKMEEPVIVEEKTEEVEKVVEVAV